MNRPSHPSTATNPTGEARHGHGGGAEKESSHGENPLFDQVLESDNLRKAWKQVKANKGASGIDGMTIEEFPRFIREHWDSIRAKLRDGSYHPSPVKRIEIPKPDGTNQWLSEQGVPSIEQRWITIRYPEGPKSQAKAGGQAPGGLRE